MKKVRFEIWYEGRNITNEEISLTKMSLTGGVYNITNIIMEKYNDWGEEKIKRYLKSYNIKIYNEFIEAEDKYGEGKIYIMIDRNDSKMIEKIKKFRRKYLKNESEINKFLKGLI